MNLTLSLEYQDYPQTANPGEPITYRELLQRGGECPALAVRWTNVFPSSVEIIDASSLQGTPTWDNTNHSVNLLIGELQRAEAELIVTVIPRQPGTITNLVSVGLNWPDVHLEDNQLALVTAVQGKSLEINRLATNKFQLCLVGSSDHPYRVEASTDLVSWETVADNITADDWCLMIPEIPRVRFYRAITK